MCGIVGYQGDFEPQLLEAMRAAVAHRGPDGEGAMVLPGRGSRATVGLAHRRLAIIDLSPEGGQPMVACCERCGSTGADLVLSYNGEIYNFAELRCDLERRGHRFRSRTDSEVLLHLYAEYGLEMLGMLNGIFAFGLYDGRERGRPPGVEPGDLLLARDPLGVKPLYFSELDAGFCFASEIKALLHCPGLSRELEPAAVHYHLAYLWSPAPLTALRSVRKLPPGHAMLVREGRAVRTWEYYDLPYGDAALVGGTDALAAELRERLETAVRRQLMSDVPVGAFLSGGLDSSAVVAMMRRVQPDKRPRCYCIGFAGGEGIDGVPPDLPFARRVADHLGVDLQTLEVRSDMIRNLERMLYQLDEPQADPAPINALLIAEQARRDGIPVLLSGAGGDDLFSGYRRHQALRAERLWAWLPAAARAGVASLGRALPQRGALGRRLVKALEHADLPAEQRLVAYFWWSADATRRSLYSAEFAARLNGTDTAAPLLKSLERIQEERDPLNRMLYLEAKHFLADHNLNYTDKMGMAAGIEVRVPLLDLELVEFATRVPSGLKQRGRTGKYLLKRAMEPLLPREVIHRPKTGFGAPLRHWIRNQLRDQVDECLSPDSIRRRGLFDPQAVRGLVERDRAGQLDGAYTIFALVCLELWSRMFVDSSPSGVGRCA